MEAQEYLNSLIKDCDVYAEKSTEYKNIYSKLFPDLNGEQDVKEKIQSMDDEDLFEYFKASQAMLDVQVIFNKVASYVYFCKNTNIELNLESTNEVNGLSNFISNYVPFNTEYVITPEGDMKEKNTKQFRSKFEEFKKSLGVIIKM